jgi:hypothetical protein
MYATLRRYTINEGDVQEMSRKAQEGLAPRLAKTRGFHSYHVFSSDARTLWSVAVFDSRSQAEEANRLALDWAEHNLKGALTFADAAVGEVTVSALASAPAPLADPR